MRQQADGSEANNDHEHARVRNQRTASVGTRLRVHGDQFRHGQPTSREDGIGIIRAAVDAGVTLFDTAEAYGPFTNEALVGEALGPVRDRVVIATKFGFKLDNGKQVGLKNRPSQIRDVAEASLSGQDRPHPDLFSSRVDAAADLCRAGRSAI